MEHRETVFLDTNILMDFLLNRIPFSEDAKLIFQLAVTGDIDIFVSDLTIVNTVYIARRNKVGLSEIYKFLDNIDGIVNIATTGPFAINMARQQRNGDFEDAVQYYSAVNAMADCIVTRNERDFPQGDIPVLAPKEFLSKYYEE